MIVQLLGGVLVAAFIFGTILWCLYRVVKDGGWKRWVHAAMMIVLIAAFTPWVYSNRFASAGIAVLILCLAPAFIVANRWPTVLLIIPPLLLALMFIFMPDALVQAA
ncbi:MAG: hypothetical protein AAGJ34_08885 [Pseudomonadota bacterium]